ncbi:MAG: hypothetical protein AB7O88_11540 [Reyranellaceae bacterium]
MSDLAHHSIDDDLARLNRISGAASAPDFLRLAIRGAYRDRIALVVSGGAASTVLLHMVAGIDRNTPVIVPDGPVLQAPIARLGLVDIRPAASLALALDGFEAWVDGRPAAGGRRSLVEAVDGRLKLDPLASWSARDIETYLIANSLQAGAPAPHH